MRKALHSRISAGPAAMLMIGAVAAPLLSPVPAVAGPGLVKHCGGTLVARSGIVKLVVSRIRVSAVRSGAVRVYPVRPSLSCRGARRVVQRYLLAKLHRPVNRCAGPAASGSYCQVGGWLCFKDNPHPPVTFGQTCGYHEFTRNALRGNMYIRFREVDRD